MKHATVTHTRRLIGIDMYTRGRTSTHVGEEMPKSCFSSKSDKVIDILEFFSVKY